MDPMIGAALISTFGSLLGGGLGAAFGGGGVEGLDKGQQSWLADFNWKQSLRNEQFQQDQFAFNQDLAKHGIKMRVDDAVSAGLHPLMGAGVNPAQGASGAFGSMVGGSPASKRSRDFGFIDRLGQDISRAWSSTATKEEKLMKAAELARIQADTAESQARKVLAQQQAAELGKTPPIPNKYIQVLNEHGDVETIFNPDVAAGWMVDPLGSWANSFKKAFGGPDSNFGGKPLQIQMPRDRHYYSTGR